LFLGCSIFSISSPNKTNCINWNSNVSHISQSSLLSISVKLSLSLYIYMCARACSIVCITAPFMRRISKEISTMWTQVPNWKTFEMLGIKIISFFLWKLKIKLHVKIDLGHGEKDREKKHHYRNF
jgi:hypothetical protein